MSNVKMATGVMLIDAPASALNNAGLDRGRQAENKVVVKKIRLPNNKAYPYVSGQAVKRWWREALYSQAGWEPSPIAREERVAYTAGDPITYKEDDLFGYMVAPAKEGGKGIVYRRIAPLKCTPFISLFENVITDDFGVFARGGATENPVPFEQEFYSTIMKGTYSLMLTEVGVYQRGRSYDIPAQADVEYKKLDAKAKKPLQGRIALIEEAAKKKRAAVTAERIVLPEDERKRRITEALEVLPELSGGAKLTNYLTDVTPRLLITAVINCANHIFMDVVGPINSKENEKGFGIHWETLEQVIEDYRERFLSPLYIGFRKGFLDQSDEKTIVEHKPFGEDEKAVQVVSGSPKEVMQKLIERIGKMQL